MEREFLTTAQAAKYLGVSVSTLYRAVSQKALSCIRTPGGQRRFLRSELDDYLERSRFNTAPQNPSQYKQGKSLVMVANEPTVKVKSEYEYVPDVTSSKPTNEHSPKERETASTDKSTQEPSNTKRVVRNTLNDLSGKEWIAETKTVWFQKGLGSSHPEAQIERLHPAPFSYQDVARLIRFFTKQGQRVLDPFVGVGSTLKAAVLNGRDAVGIEIVEKWVELSHKRMETEVGERATGTYKVIHGDSTIEIPRLASQGELFDFIVTSPPYWSILGKKPDHKVKEVRLKQGVDVKYSNDERDLGNIEDYDLFLDRLSEFFLNCWDVLHPGKYMAIVVSDFRHGSKYIPFHSDLLNRLTKSSTHRQFELHGIKILVQNHKKLYPYGYPSTYVPNIHHQYVLIFRKPKIKAKRGTTVAANYEHHTAAD
ncbi:excisionase family DNA binding protein [Planifilum fimeticola]|uniref:Methyltransferase n=1 Tax=Planifilum fimeticola TaxID=201975 RepID=A0A2T0LAN6_9BACL|nr:DNA methyltransferase [Planifilum fimeticola]PRX38902.1 excisionase family DNA binding protein [Planifilum fimeticola]